MLKCKIRHVAPSLYFLIADGLKFGSVVKIQKRFRSNDSKRFYLYLDNFSGFLAFYSLEQIKYLLIDLYVFSRKDLNFENLSILDFYKKSPYLVYDFLIDIPFADVRRIRGF